MSWSKQSIDDVKAAARLEDVIGHETKLVKMGSALQGRCCLPGHEDSTPSLVVDVAKQVYRCHGCGKGGDVIRFAQEMRGLTFPEAVKALAAEHGVTLQEEAREDGRRCVAAYRYTDVAGALLYTIERWEPGKHGRSKDFIQRLPNGEAKKAEHQVLFGLPAVVAAVAANQVVYVTEGEKAAEALRKLGVVVTTHAGGTGAVSKSWTPEFAAPLKGARVVLLPDNDDVGRKAMDQVATVLVDIAQEVRVAILPVIGKGHDAFEWIQDLKGTRAQLEQLAEQAPVLKRSSDLGSDEHLTDSGNAERWVERFGGDFRFHAGHARWLRWNGQRWESDDVGRALLATKEIARSFLADVQSCESAQRRIELVKHANRSEGKGRREAMLALAAQEKGVTIKADAVDADPWKLNVLNGTIDLRTGKLHPHSRADLCSKIAPVAFDPEATAPAFEAFLTSSLPDADVRGFVQRFLGYSLTGVVREHILPVFWGSGGNGKGTLVEAVKAVVGDYAQAVPAELLLQRQGESHPTELATLLGLRLAFASETGRGQALSEKTVKTLTGDDTISARFMRQDFFNFRPTHKLVLQTNHKPIVKGTDRGIWRRLRLVPFDVVPLTPDLHLKDKLAAERPGILRWLVQGCLDWQAHGLGSAGRIDEATEGYREESDLIGAFLEECCSLREGIRASAADVYAAYRKWCEARGENAWTQRSLGAALSERGLQRMKTSGAIVYLGVGLLHRDEGTNGDRNPVRPSGETKFLGGTENHPSPSLRPSGRPQQQSFTKEPEEEGRDLDDIPWGGA